MPESAGSTARKTNANNGMSATSGNANVRPSMMRVPARAMRTSGSL